MNAASGRTEETPAAGPAPSARRRPWDGSLATRGAQLVALSAFALSQPLFDLLSRNAEFFAVRGSTRGEIVLFALALTIAPPLVLLALEALAGLVDRRLAHGLHLVFMAGLVALFAAQALKKVEVLGSPAILAGSLLLAALAVAAYARLEPVRRLLTVLAPASLLFLVLFLFFSPVTKLVFPPAPRVEEAAAGTRSGAPPIVFVILDEFPVSAVMTSSGQIDPVRYPNLAAFARSATWFPNATTVSWETVHAVPALLTGRRPDEDLLPVFADHPRNLFTLLRGRYRLNVHERRTRMCPANLCAGADQDDSLGEGLESLFSDVGVLYAHMVAPPAYERRLPSVARGWGDFLADEAAEDATGGRAKLPRWERFLASLRATGGPALNFLHLELPHEPWSFLPSCRLGVSRVGRSETPGLSPDTLTWTDDEWVVTQAHQRFLLQVACVDRLVGQLVRRLEEIGLYESSLVVLASDHGVSVRPGEARRRVDPGSATNLADLAFPLLLVKQPGQERGETILRHVETIDILPTVSEATGVPIPWAVDGHSLWDARHDPEEVAVVTPDGTATASFAALARKRDELVERQVGLFGEGDDRPGLFGSGPHPELVGQRVEDLRAGRSTALRATIAREAARLVRDLPDGAEIVPTPVHGSLEGEGAADRLPLAIAVNGRIAAVTWSSGRGSTAYSASVPEDSFRPGRNRVEVFAIEERRGGVALVSLGYA